MNLHSMKLGFAIIFHGLRRWHRNRIGIKRNKEYGKIILAGLCFVHCARDAQRTGQSNKFSVR